MVGLHVSAEPLKAFIERLERLEEEKAEITEQIRNVLAEAKGSGYDPKTLKKVLKLRGMKDQERNEQEALLDTYLSALGMLPAVQTPTS